MVGNEEGKGSWSQGSCASCQKNVDSSMLSKMRSQKRDVNKGLTLPTLHYSWITVDVRVIQKEQDPNQELYSLFPLFY